MWLFGRVPVSRPLVVGAIVVTNTDTKIWRGVTAIFQILVLIKVRGLEQELYSHRCVGG
jgi:hypothetical protein